MTMKLYMLERHDSLNKSAILKGKENHLKEDSVTVPGTIRLFSCSATHSRRDTVLKCCSFFILYLCSFFWSSFKKQIIKRKQDQHFNVFTSGEIRNEP